MGSRLKASEAGMESGMDFDMEVGEAFEYREKTQALAVKAVEERAAKAAAKRRRRRRRRRQHRRRSRQQRQRRHR